MEGPCSSLQGMRLAGSTVPLWWKVAQLGMCTESRAHGTSWSVGCRCERKENTLDCSPPCSLPAPALPSLLFSGTCCLNESRGWGMVSGVSIHGIKESFSFPDDVSPGSLSAETGAREEGRYSRFCLGLWCQLESMSTPGANPAWCFRSTPPTSESRMGRCPSVPVSHRVFICVCCVVFIGMAVGSRKRMNRGLTVKPPYN